MAKQKDKTGPDAGEESAARTMRVKDIKTRPELSGIFTVNETVLASVVKSMKEKGYDRSQPVVLWKGRNCVVDGHTRLKAAREAGIAAIPVVEREFGSLEEAVEYAFKRQAERRNLTQPEIFLAAIRLKIKDHRDGSGRSGELLAKELNVPASTIRRARTIAVRASEEDIEAVRTGELSINQAYQKVQKTTKPAADSPARKAGDYSETGDSISVKFLRPAVILLGEEQEARAAGLLIKRFLRKGQREPFLNMLPRKVRDIIEQAEGGIPK
jgi:ParB family chromosome partitioning protein